MINRFKLANFHFILSKIIKIIPKVVEIQVLNVDISAWQHPWDNSRWHHKNVRQWSSILEKVVLERIETIKKRILTISLNYSKLYNTHLTSCGICFVFLKFSWVKIAIIICKPIKIFRSLYYLLEITNLNIARKGQCVCVFKNSCYCHIMFKAWERMNI